MTTPFWPASGSQRNNHIVSSENNRRPQRCLPKRGQVTCNWHQMLGKENLCSYFPYLLRIDKKCTQRDAIHVKNGHTRSVGKPAVNTKCSDGEAETGGKQTEYIPAKTV